MARRRFKVGGADGVEVVVHTDHGAGRWDGASERSEGSSPLKAAVAELFEVVGAYAFDEGRNWEDAVFAIDRVMDLLQQVPSVDAARAEAFEGMYLGEWELEELTENVQDAGYPELAFMLAELDEQFRPEFTGIQRLIHEPKRGKGSKRSALLKIVEDRSRTLQARGMALCGASQLASAEQQLEPAISLLRDSVAAKDWSEATRVLELLGDATSVNLPREKDTAANGPRTPAPSKLRH